MKNFFAILTVVGLALTAQAGVIPTEAINVFGGGATNNGGAQAWVIIGNYSQNNGTPVVTAIYADTDTPATATVHAYRVTEETQCTFTNTTVSIPVTTTNTGTKWDSGDIIIRHKYYNTYEKRTLTTSGGATNLQVTAASLTAVTPGDTIYKVLDDQFLGGIAFETNTVGLANSMVLRRSGSAPLLVGQKGLPLMLQVTSTNAAKAFLYGVSGYYAP